MQPVPPGHLFRPRPCQRTNTDQTTSELPVHGSGSPTAERDFLQRLSGSVNGEQGVLTSLLRNHHSRQKIKIYCLVNITTIIDNTPPPIKVCRLYLPKISIWWEKNECAEIPLLRPRRSVARGRYGGGGGSGSDNRGFRSCVFHIPESTQSRDRVPGQFRRIPLVH
jgi:hypothetical protein